jgi:hypothetical protein
MQVVQPNPTRLKPELVEIFLQTGLLEIFADDLRTGRQRCLHPGLCRQTFRRGFARQQAGTDHDIRIGGIGAGRDRGNDDIAVAEIVTLAGYFYALLRFGALAEFLVHRHGKSGFDFFKATRSCGRFGPDNDGSTELNSSLSTSVKIGSGRRLHAVHALRLGIGRNERDDIGRTGPCPSCNECIVIDRREAARRAIFGRHVAECRAVGDGQMREAGAEELDELSDLRRACEASRSR